MSTRALPAYVVVAAADATLAAVGRRRARFVTKPLLMPLLMLGQGERTRRALTLCWVGDVALLGRGRAAFAAGLGSFLAGHVAWIAELRSRSGGSLLKRAPYVAVPHALAFAGLNAFLWRRTGADRGPVVAYSAAVTALALAAVDTGSPRTACGGALFMLSDSLIAVERFADIKLPLHGGLVMLTYTAAQALLTESVAG